MQVNIFLNRENPNELKFFIAPASLLAWIKEIPANGDTWNQVMSSEISEDLKILGFKEFHEMNVSFFNYENEILKRMQELAPEVFSTMASAWIAAEKNGHKVIKTISFVEN